MANSLVALGVQQPQINTMAAFDQSQANELQNKSTRMAQARQGLEWVGSMALGAMGGKIDGEADPARWEEGISMLAGQVDDSVLQELRARPDLAPVIARASLDTMQQLSVANSDRDYELALKRFDQQVAEAADASQHRAWQRGQASQPKPVDLPAGVDEYNWYADQEKAAGNEPISYLEFQQAKKGGGFSVTTADGTVVQMGGAGKPLTEGQSKDTTYATRAEGALPTIDEFGAELTNPVARAVEGDPTGVVRGAAQSPEFQKANQAGLEFLQAILRKDTGAAITPAEQEEYGRVYLPMPGDSQEVLGQKKQSRKRALEALKAGMPPNAILAQEGALERSGGATPAAAAPSNAPEPNTVEDGYRFKGGDPADPNNWERAE